LAKTVYHPNLFSHRCLLAHDDDLDSSHDGLWSVVSPEATIS
jgi:hypothetical protein